MDKSDILFKFVACLIILLQRSNKNRNTVKKLRNWLKNKVTHNQLTEWIRQYRRRYQQTSYLMIAINNSSSYSGYFTIQGWIGNEEKIDSLNQQIKQEGIVIEETQEQVFTA